MARLIGFLDERMATPIGNAYVGLPLDGGPHFPSGTASERYQPRRGPLWTTGLQVLGR